LIARRVYLGNAGGSGTFNFNGGLLQAAPGASADFMSGLSSVNILGGGAFIDSAANNITITQDLYPDYISNGGLTKLGAGSLTLAGYLYYTGPTLVSAGKLALTTHAFSLGAITVADGAELGLQVLDYAGANLAVAGLTLGSATGATLDFDLGSFGNPSAAPCNVSGGTLTVNGAITLNIDPNSSLSVGQFPLIQFGSRAGAGTFVLGTLPPGVFAELVNTANTVELKVNSVFQPRWEGLAGGNWDVQLTTNWVDAISGEPQYFYQGSRAVFNDLASGVTTVNLTTNASPGGVLVSNSALVYTIQGPGRFTGGGGLTKLGAGTLTLSTTNNNYTGPTLIDEGGTLVSTVANNLGTNSALTIGSGALSLGANSQRFSSVTLTNGTIAASGATVTAASFNLENGSVSALLAGGSLSTFGATPGDMISVAGGNTYTGRTVLVGSLLVVTNLANGGSPSGIGASSANPTNLVFGGGGLGYSGPAVAIDRGYTVAGGGALNLDNDVALGGPVASSSGNFAKGGPGKLTYGALGTNFLSRGGGANAYSIGAGTVVFNGGASTPTNYFQTNYIQGELWIGYTTTNAAALVLTNSSLGISSWLAIDRGNGIDGYQSVCSLYDSVLWCANASMGYDAAIPGNNTHPVLNLYGNSQFIDTNSWYVGESIGADAKVGINGASAVTIGGSALLGRSAGSTGTVVVANSGSLTVNGGSGWLSIGASGDGTLTLKDTSLLNVPLDENVA
ncbi:MAG TPA: autotransporter-associated beta strand repeat-containing protein, partial [Candidatus Sulfotelmatobacter sp.]|nr:autotransporter-associated beta strand repeat-containing protein [Candidatus Sulfotelmatobacter sp.]